MRDLGDLLDFSNSIFLLSCVPFVLVPFVLARCRSGTAADKFTCVAVLEFSSEAVERFEGSFHSSFNRPRKGVSVLAASSARTPSADG